MSTKFDPITRRSILLNLALGTATTLSAPLAVFADTPVKGPIVWLDMDQEELDKAYSQYLHAPNIEQVIARWGTNSALARKRLGEPKRFAYGSKPIESLDIYPTTYPNAPVHIFIHGGAWQQGTAESYGFPAELFVNAGVHYVVPDFSRKPITFYCATGGRSLLAAKLAVDMGVPDPVTLEGGFKAWVEADGATTPFK